MLGGQPVTHSVQYADPGFSGTVSGNYLVTQFGHSAGPHRKEHQMTATKASSTFTKTARRFAIAAGVGAIAVGALAGPAAAAAPAAPPSPVYLKGTTATIHNSTDKMIRVETKSYVQDNIRSAWKIDILKPGETTSVSGYNLKSGKADITGSILYAGKDKTVTDFSAATNQIAGGPWFGFGEFDTSSPAGWAAAVSQGKVKGMAPGASYDFTAKDRQYTVERDTSGVAITNFDLYVK